MMKLRLFSISMLTLLVFSSCRDKLVGPPNNPTTSSSDTIAYWTFVDGASGLKDVTGNGHNGTANTNIEYATDRFGNANSALLLNGKNYVSVPSTTNLNFSDSDSYSISGWVNLSGSDTNFLITKDFLPYNVNRTGSYAIYSIRGQFYAQITGNPPNAQAVWLYSNNPVPFGEWHMVTLVVAAHSSATLYIDSTMVTSKTDTMTWSNLMNDFSPLLIGAPATMNPTQDSITLDDFIIMHHAMSTADVQARFHEGGWYERASKDTVTLPPSLTGRVITGNKFVTALVEAQTGLITFIDAAGTGATSVPPGKSLSYMDKSFLSIVADTFLTPAADSGYYSNNNLMPTNLSLPIGQTRPLPGYQWHNLVSGVTSKIGDTIETIWKNLGEDIGFAPAFDFMQDVYPVAFDSSGQIVVSVKVINHGSISHSFAAQYLNDGMISDGTSANDNVFIVNSIETVGDRWKLYQGNVPTYFAAFSADPRQKTGSAPPSLGIGFLSDGAAPAPMGLIPPSAVYHCDWPVAAGYGFGAANQTGPTFDMATLLQWPSVSVTPGSEVEIMRTSYGTNQMPLSQMPIH